MPSPIDFPIEGTEPPGAMWVHSAAPDVSDAARRGMARALSGDWSSGPLALRAADLRGWLVMHAWARARLAGSVTASPVAGVGLLVDPGPVPGAAPEAAGAAAVLAATPELLAVAVGGPLFAAPGALATRDELPSETGALPVVAVVGIALASAAAVVYVAHQAAQVVDNYLSRSDRARRVLQADARALEVIEKHTEREDTQGKKLPLDDASRAVLAELAARQKQMAAADPPPISSGAPEVGAGAGFGFGAALALAALGAVLYLKG